MLEQSFANTIISPLQQIAFAHTLTTKTSESQLSFFITLSC